MRVSGHRRGVPAKAIVTTPQVGETRPGVCVNRGHQTETAAGWGFNCVWVRAKRPGSGINTYYGFLLSPACPASWYISRTVGSWCLNKLGLLNPKDKKERLWNTISIKYLNRGLRDCNCRVVGLGLVRMALGQMCTSIIWTRIGQDLGTRQFAPAVCDLICGACELSRRHCYNLWSYQGLHRTKGTDVPNS